MWFPRTFIICFASCSAIYHRVCLNLPFSERMNHLLRFLQRLVHTSLIYVSYFVCDYKLHYLTDWNAGWKNESPRWQGHQLFYVWMFCVEFLYQKAGAAGTWSLQLFECWDPDLGRRDHRNASGRGANAEKQQEHIVEILFFISMYGCSRSCDILHVACCIWLYVGYLWLKLSGVGIHCVQVFSENSLAWMSWKLPT